MGVFVDGSLGRWRDALERRGMKVSTEYIYVIERETGGKANIRSREIY